jgi:hypothetical protein
VLVVSKRQTATCVWLDVAGPHKNLVVDVTVTSALENSSAPAVGALQTLPNSFGLGA